MSFTSLGLPQSLQKALEDQKYTEAYPIQKEAIPAILKKKDVLGIAQTGSGKTASYVLPILSNLQTGSISKNRHIKTLVLVPTRELAAQVLEVFEQFSAALANPVKCLAVHGGVSINPQMKAMNKVDVLVATPGRLLELQDSNAVHLSEIETLVLDEADKMLNLGFADEMNRIFALLPKKRQNLLFSATLSKNVEDVNQVLLKDPLVIKIEAEVDTFDLIDQIAYSISEEKKGPLLRHIIKKNDLQQVLIFTSTAHRADAVAYKLSKNGIQATSTHSKKSQGARTENLRKFKTGKLRVLVATDLLTRGIDIEFLPYVVNYDLPRSPKDYIHRIGRTGRAESSGEAISFVTTNDEHHFRVIQKKVGKRINLIDTKNIDTKG